MVLFFSQIIIPITVTDILLSFFLIDFVIQNFVH